jgi:hypothetical protein
MAMDVDYGGGGVASDIDVSSDVEPAPRKRTAAAKAPARKAAPAKKAPPKKASAKGRSKKAVVRASFTLNSLHKLT